MTGELAERPYRKARKLLKRLKDTAKLNHALIYFPGVGEVMIELPKAKKQ